MSPFEYKESESTRTTGVSKRELLFIYNYGTGEVTYESPEHKTTRKKSIKSPCTPYDDNEVI